MHCCTRDGFENSDRMRSPCSSSWRSRRRAHRCVRSANFRTRHTSNPREHKNRPAANGTTHAKSHSPCCSCDNTVGPILGLASRRRHATEASSSYRLLSHVVTWIPPSPSRAFARPSACTYPGAVIVNINSTPGASPSFEITHSPDSVTNSHPFFHRAVSPLESPMRAGAALTKNLVIGLPDPRRSLASRHPASRRACGA